jgi:hypothetical protein
VIDPEDAPLQVTFVLEAVKTKGVGAVIVVEAVAVHKFASVNVKLYAPRHKLEIEGVLPPLLHE